MASYTKEEFAQMMAQMEDSGQRITKITEKGVCITAAVRKDIRQNRPLTDTMDEIAYNELKHKNKKLTARIKELENSLSIALEINDKDQREHKKLCERIAELTK
jgi:ribosomal protein L11 methylase PrmA